MFMFECQLKCHFILADMMAKIVKLETLKITGILCEQNTDQVFLD
jgi:hypothetical protein